MLQTGNGKMPQLQKKKIHKNVRSSSEGELGPVVWKTQPQQDSRVQIDSWTGLQMKQQ